MLKATNIFVSILLATMLFSCKKEKAITLPDSTPQQEVFIISDVANYDTAYFYINKTIKTVNNGTSYNLDNDSLNDLSYYHTDSYDHYTNTWTIHIGFYSNPIIEFATTGSGSLDLFPYQLGDTLDANLYWQLSSSFGISHFFEPQYSQSRIAFRKTVNGVYKYGFINLFVNPNTGIKIGPSVMQQ